MLSRPDARTTTQPAAVSWLVWLGILVVYIWLRVPLLEVPLDRDEGAFAVVGQAILHGDLPYRDIFDHKPPGLFYLFASALFVFPSTAVGLHLFLLIWNLGTLVAVAALARELDGGRTARWSALGFAIASACFAVQGFSASSEMLLLLPLTLSVWAAVRARGSASWLLASGALGAAACWIKQPAAVVLLVVPLYLAVAGQSRSRSARGRDVAMWLAGGVGLSVAVVVPFLLLGVGREFWYWSFTHSAIYARLSAHAGGTWLLSAFGELLRDLWFPLAVGFAGMAWGWARRGSGYWLAPAMLLLSVVAVLHSSFAYAHYFALLLPAIALVFGLGMTRLVEGLPYRRLAAPLAVLLTLTAPLASRPWYWLWPDPAQVSFRALGAQGFDAAPLLARYIEQNTNPDEHIFIYGSEPQIAFLARRRNANPFVMAYPLTGPWPRQREFQERTWAEIQTTRPAFILIARTPLSLLDSPATDPYLVTRLRARLDVAYVQELFLRHEPGRGLSLVPVADDTAGDVLFEIWRGSPRSIEQPRVRQQQEGLAVNR